MTNETFHFIVRWMTIDKCNIQTIFVLKMMTDGDMQVSSPVSSPSLLSIVDVPGGGAGVAGAGAVTEAGGELTAETRGPVTSDHKRRQVRGRLC